MDKMKIFCLSAMLCAFSSSMIFADSDSAPGPINEAKVRCQKEAEMKISNSNEYNLNAVGITQKNVDQITAAKKDAIKAEKARCQQEANKELRQFMQELPPKTINPNGGSFKSDKGMMNHNM